MTSGDCATKLLLHHYLAQEQSCRASIFVVKETAKVRYEDQAQREGKSLGQWMREAADEKLAATLPRKFTVEDLREFAAEV